VDLKIEIFVGLQLQDFEGNWKNYSKLSKMAWYLAHYSRQNPGSKCVNTHTVIM